jgi:adenylate kinase
MKAFICNVDTPFGHSLCRLLSVTLVGSRAEEGEEEEIQLDSQTGEALPKKEKSLKDNYYITGTLLHSDKANSHKQVNMIESGDKKKGFWLLTLQMRLVERLLKEQPYLEKCLKVLFPSLRYFNYTKIQKENTELLKETILSSDVIVFDINSLEETTFAINRNYKLIEVLIGAELEKPKTFIAISSIMTWSKTKIEAEEAESLTEDEYRRRKPHPNFKDHLALEKEI